MQAAAANWSHIGPQVMSKQPRSTHKPPVSLSSLISAPMSMWQHSSAKLPRLPRHNPKAALGPLARHFTTFALSSLTKILSSPIVHSCRRHPARRLAHVFALGIFLAHSCRQSRQSLSGPTGPSPRFALVIRPVLMPHVRRVARHYQRVSSCL